MKKDKVKPTQLTQSLCEGIINKFHPFPKGCKKIEIELVDNMLLIQGTDEKGTTFYNSQDLSK